MVVAVTPLEQFRVFISDALHADLTLWTAAPSILPISLATKLFPEIDVAKFVYHVGVFPVHFAGVTPGTYAPIVGMRRFIRLQIWKVYDDDMTPLPEEDQELLDDWIGVIDRTDLDNLYGGTVPAGDLSFTAFGLASELDHVTVTKTHIAKSQTGTDADDYFEITRAVGFNEDFRNAKPGNMHSAAGFTGVKVFAKVPNREVTNDTDDELAAQWTVKHAIEYTLRRDLSAYTSSYPLPDNSIQWDYETQTDDLLDSLPFPKLARDRKTALQILSELVPKKSGIVCRIKFDDAGIDATKLRVFLDYISTAKDAFTVDAFTFPASPEQTSLDLRFSPLIDDTFSISESAYDSWDQVIVESAFITSTMTLPVDTDLKPFVKSWSDEQEAEYVTPDLDSGLSTEDANKMADRIRNSKEYAEVFRTWVIKYPQFETPLLSFQEFRYSPKPHMIGLDAIPEGGTAGIFEAYEADESGSEYPFDLYRKEFLSQIPIAHRPMKNQSKFPSSIWLTKRVPADELVAIDYDASSFTDGTRLDNAGGWYEGRSWSVNISVGGGETRNSETFCGPCVRLDVSGGPQHYIAPEEMDGVEYISAYNDPTTDKVDALSWKNAFVTVSIETDLRYLAKYPLTLTLTTDSPPRIKRVLFDQLRLDFALPGYVKRIRNDGTLDFTTTGEMLRDDRKLIEVATQTIWQMSWIARRPFSVAFAEIHPQSLTVGALVLTVETAAGIDTTNTVLSQIEYDFKTFKTKFMTQFEETDVVESLIGVSLQSSGSRRGR